MLIDEWTPNLHNCFALELIYRATLLYHLSFLWINEIILFFAEKAR